MINETDTLGGCRAAPDGDLGTGVHLAGPAANHTKPLTPYFQNNLVNSFSAPLVRVLQGDCLAVLPTLDAESVQCCVTSPPYWGLRAYLPDGHEDKVCELGTEPIPDAYVANLVRVFREVWRVLKDDGVCFLNLGDSYAGSKTGNTNNGSGKSGLLNDGRKEESRLRTIAIQAANMAAMSFSKPLPPGLKPKDLCMIPARVALALQADGWFLRSEIVWAKPNPMPESVTDRCTKSHEMIYMLTKQGTYFYDAEAVKESSIYAGDVKTNNGNAGMCNGFDGHRTRDGFKRGVTVNETRNKRSVWTVATSPYSEAHFATFPPDLIKPCILAGSRVGRHRA